VATNGWTLDPQGRATSKSLGNGIDPVDISKRLGAEIVRLWVASVDFQEDVRVSEELMQRVAENYRKIRNTFRFILGNFYDFDPQLHSVPFAEMHPLDQYMLLRTAELSERARKWYESFEFHRIYHQVNEFCTVDLSAVYFDVLKDRLYTSAPNSRARRSAQTVTWRIGEALVLLMAPIMTFTAEEVWSFLPKVANRPQSVHLAYFPKTEEITGTIADLDQAQAMRADFDVLMGLREEVLKALEVARRDKLIGSALEALVTIHAPENLYKILERHRDDMRFLLIASGVELKRAAGGNGSAAIHVEVSRAPGTKCERCWNYSLEVGKNERYPTVCERCLAALNEIEQEQAA
jgi:isoleucyl-tRNA synthetase